MSDTKIKLRWFQYSLRTVLIIVTLCAIPCSWLALKMRQAKRQREAVAAIEKLGGGVLLSEPSGPKWLRSLVGEDFSQSVESVQLDNTQATDSGLEHLKGFSQLKFLSLYGTEVTDAGLEHLKGLSQLQELDLRETNVTDSGLAHLKGLSQLKSLYLIGTKVTDAGLEHLKDLSQLKSLYLSTKVTPAGVRRIKQALPNCTID
jgi:hypothetical protein